MPSSPHRPAPSFEFVTLGGTRGLALGMSATVAGLSPVLVLHASAGVPLPHLVRDAAAVTNTPVHTGLLSNLGLFGWSAATALWVVNALILRRGGRGHPLAPLSVGLALLSAVLLVDDAFMLHERIFPHVLGIHERLVMGGYAVAAVLCLASAPRAIGRTDWGTWGISLACLAGSVGADLLLEMTPVTTLVEDGLKFAGIAFWTVYAGSVTMQIGGAPGREDGVGALPEEPRPRPARSATAHPRTSRGIRGTPARSASS